MTRDDVGRLRRHRGFALIVVLWFLVLLAAIGTYLLTNARSETALARNVLAAARAEAVADAAVAQAVFNLSSADPNLRWKLDGTPYTLALPGGKATIQLMDERMKINPNLASETLMSGLFQSLGVEKAEADRLGAAVSDWVQPGADARALIDKAEPYQRDGRDYGPPGAPFASLDELQLVIGMTPAIFAAARPYLTIYTNTPAPADRKAMPEIILRAVEIAERNPVGRTAARPPPPQMSGAPVAGPSAATTVATLDITARSRDGGTFVREAVVRLEPDSAKGYAVLEWRRGEGIPAERRGNSAIRD